jgi:capsular exopolysaccharide synthesis family protein
MNFSHALAALRRRWPALVAFVLLFVCLGVAHSALTEPTYKSTTSVYLRLERGDTVGELAQGSTYLQSLVESYADVATSRLVLAPVIQQLQLKTSPESLANRVAAEARPDTAIMDISVTDRSAQGAARTANAVATQLGRAVSALAPSARGRLAVVTVTTLTPATVPTSPASPKPARDVILGLGIGLVLGVLAVALLDAVGAPVDNRDSAVEAAGAPVVATVPRDRSTKRQALPVLTGPTRPRTEGIWMLRANLQLRQPTDRPMAVVITSAVPSEGRTGIAVNLAIAMSHTAKRVLLIDADLHKPRVAQLLELDQSANPEARAGLAGVLIGEARFADVVQTWIGQDGGRSTLSVVTAGTSTVNPSELLASETMEDLLSTAKLEYDVILIDTAPLLTLAGSAVLAARADGALLVVDSRRTRMAQVTEAVTRLGLAGAKVLGVVLNNTRKGLSPLIPRHLEEPAAPADRPAATPAAKAAANTAPAAKTAPVAKAVPAEDVPVHRPAASSASRWADDRDFALQYRRLRENGHAPVPYDEDPTEEVQQMRGGADESS